MSRNLQHWSLQVGKAAMWRSDWQEAADQFDAIITNGGRVLTITAQGNTISEAVDTSKKALALIQFEGMNFRTDIGYEFKG